MWRVIFHDVVSVSKNQKKKKADLIRKASLLGVAEEKKV